MPNMYMTRGDENVGMGRFDSIAWIYETHLKIEDEFKYNYAILIGYNEDSPYEIMLWKDEPRFDQKPDAHYKLQIGENEEEIWQLVTI